MELKTKTRVIVWGSIGAFYLIVSISYIISSKQLVLAGFWSILGIIYIVQAVIWGKKLKKEGKAVVDNDLEQGCQEDKESL